MTDRLTLDQVENTTKVSVAEIHGGWGVRHRLNRMGIHPGDLVLVKRSGILSGPILIQVHGMDVALGRGLAGKVIVSEITE